MSYMINEHRSLKNTANQNRTKNLGLLCCHCSGQKKKRECHSDGGDRNQSDQSSERSADTGGKFKRLTGKDEL